MDADYKLLEELGLGGIPKNEQDLMISDIRETMANRIGARAEQHLSEEKLDEFEKLVQTTDFEAMMRWLDANMPNFKQIVAEEEEKIKAEIMPQVPQILSDIAAGVPNPNA